VRDLGAPNGPRWVARTNGVPDPAAQPDLLLPGYGRATPGQLAALPLDQRQVGEVLLTAAQSLFGLAVLARLRFGLVDAALLAALFVGPLVLGGVLRAGLHNAEVASAELFWFAGLYLVR
jgi:hypothetical protein